MKIHFHGAAQTVTGSMHLLEVNGAKMLLDCGLYQGPRKESFERNRNFPFKIKEIDAVILSHAHIDHSGNLPNLVKQGYNGPIYATPATNELANIMLQDSGHIQEKQAENVSYRKALKGEPPVDPLYTEEDAKLVRPLLKDIPYNKEFTAIPGVKARLVDAGHILGSASVELEMDEHGKKTRLWFSGDIGRRGLPIIRDPVLPERGDVLLMECTYGDKPHNDPELAYEEMCKVILRTLDRNGKVVIPAFAVGRTQELVYNLHRMYGEHKLHGVPIYVDSPLAVNASEIFKKHPECFDPEMMEQIKSGHPALEFGPLTYIKTLDESKSLNQRKDPMIIISASGMAEVGRVVHHIRWAIENPNNTIMIVSWQAPGTLGRRLAEREREVRILGEPYPVRAEIATIGGLSAHAGQDLLVEYALRLKGQARNVFLVHGEQKSAQKLMDKLDKNNMQRVFYPESRASMEI